ncbi:uncharacterized protein LOC129595971 [Paramacrobiotus metropolitanus]|uniref:uncharacterized protein LOC129595971 n=1 Tax=Paramacrobiotus metropolitanus TaxID=2943436 RepID=UPI0024461E20|nr:uncharacterized protein LOC129595971 [Paramacrobiotus metropolitanus]
MEAHIRAVHPQLLGLASDYSEAAKEERARLERLAVETAECVGEALSRSVDTEDAAPAVPCSATTTAPSRRVQGCQADYPQRDYMLWHTTATTGIARRVLSAFWSLTGNCS